MAQERDGAMMRRWLLAGILLCLLSGIANAACPLTGPQSVGSPLVVSGVDPNCNLTSRQIYQREIVSPLPLSSSGSTATLGYGQIVLSLDAPAGFTVGQIVQVTSEVDLSQSIIGVIVAYDPATFNATINTLVPDTDICVCTFFTVQVLGGSPINGVPVWAGLSIDGSTNVTNPATRGSTVSLTIEAGKAFTNFSTIYSWAPQDITTWFVGVVLSYNTTTGAMVVFVTQTANTGLAYSTNYVSLVDTQGPAPALIGYSSSNQTLGAGDFTYTTQSGQFFPIDGQALASCIDGANPNAYMAGQVKAYSGTSLIITVTANGVYGSGPCAAWSLYLTTGPTTRIGPYQMNGLQVAQSGSTATVTIAAGSVRSSDNTVDLVLSSPTTIDLTSTSKIVQVAQAGTISSSGVNVTGVATAFTTDFGPGGGSLSNSLTDINSQLVAVGQSALPGITTIISTAAQSDSIFSLTDDTHLATFVNLGVGAGTAFFRGGPINSSNTVGVLFYGIVLIKKDSDGTTTVRATAFTPSGDPDLPSGYTKYRVLCVLAVQASGGNYTMSILQVLGLSQVPEPIGAAGQTILSYTTGLNSRLATKWGKLDLTNGVTGVLPTANGGTGTSGAVFSTAQNTLSGDVSLNNTANYFDGPSMAQGTSGTWWVQGIVTVTDTAGAANILCKLWDGTTVISSGNVRTAGGSVTGNAITLGGYLASPAANIRISCKDATATTGKILFNSTGNSADASIWGIRINFLEHSIPANDNDLIERMAA